MDAPNTRNTAGQPGLALPEVEGQVLARLRHLAKNPPQTLALEGGRAGDRLAAALAWAKALNCAQGGCGSCAVCRQIDGRVLRDLIVVDKAFFDEAKADGLSGTDAMRRLLPVWGQPPTGSGQRVSIFVEAQDLNHYVANLLLKTLEEPRPGNVFVLLAPQRERLLQTLVSRSFVVTLPWPRPGQPEPDALEWTRALLDFWDSGQGWFERTGAGKGAADRGLALRVLAHCQKELSSALLSGPQAPSEEARRMARMGAAGLRRLDLMLAAAQEALDQPTVMPALVLDWMATSLIGKGEAKGPGAAPRFR